MFLDHSDPHAIALCYQGGQHGCMDEQGAHRVVKGTKDTFSFDVLGRSIWHKNYAASSSDSIRLLCFFCLRRDQISLN
jgi:hypothetical protein